MTLETIVIQFGYLALVIGLLFEGETMLILGAFMAHRGYLNLSLVILIGCIVPFASDQFFFWMGRMKGSNFLKIDPHGNRTWKRQSHCLVGIRTCFFLESDSCMVCGPSCRL
jgi:membrane protein DedA with SNARE-associated domain